jgi:hypothetical protein
LFKRKIWLYNQGDFDEYRRLLSLTDWESIFSTDDIDKITTDISNTILSAAEATIPNKLFRRLALLWILFSFLMSFLISFVNHAGSCFLIVTSLFGIVASAALKIVFEMSNISMQYSLQQLVKDPTNFTEHSSSLIDLILTNDVNPVPYAGVDPPLLDKARYHCR